MKKLNTMKNTFRLTIVALSLATGPAWALQDFYLAAKAYQKAMPGGSSIPMWGYVLDTGNGANNHCYDISGASSAPARQACVNALPDPELPGPVLTMSPSDPDIRIFLTNNLPEPTSIVITGQAIPVNVQGPTWNDGSTGSRVSPDQKVRSYGVEASPNGGRRAYVWRSSQGTGIANSGSFIYHSGTWPQKQVYMGLYGAVTKDAAAKQVYPGVGYDNEVVLFYSDIDPVINAAVENGTYSTSIDYKARWFLINGEPYQGGIADITAGPAGSQTLVRFFNTASETHVPTFQGLYATIHGEDGLQYNYQDSGVSHAAPRQQYSVELPPLKTKDAIITSAVNSRHAVYDGNGYMTNPSDPDDPNAGDTLGGMLRFLSFSAGGGGGGGNQAPIAANDSATTIVGTPVEIHVLANDSDPEGVSLSISNYDAASMHGGNVSCTTTTCTYTPPAAYNGTDNFAYTASDGFNTSAPATVTITVNANQAPTATDDQAATNQDTPVVIAVLANDSDPEGQALSISSFDPISANAGTIACGATCTYTPSPGYVGADSFNYTASDGVNTSAPATVNISVNALPVALDDMAETTQGNAIAIPVLSNDSDPDALPSPLAITEWTQGSHGTVACDSPNGNCEYRPNADYVSPAGSPDTFTYTIFDGMGSATATVSVTVNLPTVLPTKMYFSTLGAVTVAGVDGPYDDADIYTMDEGGAFARFKAAMVDLGLPNSANIDGLSIVDNETFYVSFAGATTDVPGIGAVQDEDVVKYDNGSWSLVFAGSNCGLNDRKGNGDIDAIHVNGDTLYFSTAGNANVSGVAGAGDDADIYSWNGSVCSRVFDASANGLPGSANIDGLTYVDADTFYVSFEGSTTSIAGLGTVQDEDVVLYDLGNWSSYVSGVGLNTSDAQDVDAIHVIVPTP